MLHRMLVAAALVATVLVALPVSVAQALHAGDLDPSFGGFGIVTTDVDLGFDRAHDVAIQNDGKIVAAGEANAEGPYESFGLTRYTSDGRPDPSFGGDGIVTTHFGINSDVARSVLIQGDGRIVAAGYSQMSPDQFAIARYNVDGSLDTGFGGDGVVTTPVGDHGAEGSEAALQEDGKLLVAGTAVVSGTQDFAVVRYNSDGTLDASFGGTGIVTTPVGTSHDFGKAVGIQPDGKIVVAGIGGMPPNADQFAVVRYNSDGSLDTTFDGDGVVISDIDPNGSVAETLVVQDDGKIILGGGSSSRFTLARYSTSGALDTGFDEDGIVTTQIGNGSFITDLIIQPDGKTVATGRSGGPREIALARYNIDGSLDLSFGGGDGTATSQFETYSSYAEGVSLQTDGKLVIAGYVEGPSNDFLVARFFGNVVTGSHVPGDFNGDGYADVAIGVPLEDVGTVEDAGAVNVIYGSAKRLSSTNDQFWSQDSHDVLDSAEVGDQFGYAIAAGDFNGDGFSDLAVGAPGEEAHYKPQTGAVNVFYGSPSGLSAAADQFWTLQIAGLGQSELYDIFGAVLVTGDLNGDGFADLAVGAPLRAVSGQQYAGAVAVLYGTGDGLAASGSQLWSQDSPEVEDSAEFDDEFGSALAIGDFNGNGFGDLAIGTPLEGSPEASGAVNVLYGSASGVTATGDQLWTQNTSGIVDRRETGDVFGFALAVGSFQGDKYDDLAVGVPGENIGTKTDAGAVNVIYGRSTGLSYIRNQFWSQDTTGVVDTAERVDLFGYALAIGDFNGNARDDLAIGVPSENVGSVSNAGAAAVIYGSTSRLTATGDQLWSQNSKSIRDTAEKYDQLGFSLTSGDFNGHKYDDLAVGVNLEDLGSKQDAGAAMAIYGSSSRLGATGNQFWSQDSSGILDTAESGDVFGGSMASGESKTQTETSFLAFRRFASWIRRR